MSKFVNYTKRGVTLPNGYTDLIQLLKPHGVPKSDIDTPAPSPDELPDVIRGESVTGMVSDIGKYVAMVSECLSHSVILMITPPEQQITVNVDRMVDGMTRAFVVVQAGTDQEKAVRSFLTNLGFRVADDSGIPWHFVPDLPVHVTYDISPIPPEAPLLSALLADLFRDVGLRDDSQLCFRYYEFTFTA